MSTLTTPDSLLVPVGTDAVAPLQTVLANMQNSVQTALINRGKAGVPQVASATARDALYPTPVQGQRVYRSDLGWNEQYYAAYNAGNPGGARTAGWFPAPNEGPRLHARLSSASTTMTSSNVRFSNWGALDAVGMSITTSGGFSIPVDGVYALDYGLGVASGTASGYIQSTAGTGNVYAYFSGGGIRGSGAATGSFNQGDTLSPWGSGTGGLRTDSTYLGVRWVGVRQV